jgi:hypothetical protein
MAQTTFAKASVVEGRNGTTEIPLSLKLRWSKGTMAQRKKWVNGLKNAGGI